MTLCYMLRFSNPAPEISIILDFLFNFTNNVSARFTHDYTYVSHENTEMTRMILAE